MSKPARQPPPPITVEEFLLWDDGTDTRYELIDGRIVAMASPGPAHSTIVGNLAVAIGPRLKPPCRIRIEYGLYRSRTSRNYRQADFAVVCADVAPGEPLPDPVLVVEVVSPSSLGHDRDKAGACRGIENCSCVLLVHSDRRLVERWTREGDSWQEQAHIGERGPVPLGELGFGIDLAEIHAGVLLP